MNHRIATLLREIRAREVEIAALVHDHEENIRYRLEGSKVRFESALEEMHRQFKVGVWRWLRESEPRNVLSAPVIYGMIFPMLLLDATISIYQRLCFPLFGIDRISRRDYIVIDRHQLSYLNLFEKVNCVYCGYVSGLLGYSKAIVTRTEQYWCPIKHARRQLGTDRQYAGYAAYGDAEAYPVTVKYMRRNNAEDSKR